MNDWHTIVGVISTVIFLSLIYPYIRSIIHGPTRPNIVSWAGWAFLFAIATIAQFSKGVSWSLAVPLFSTLSTSIIAVISIRRGYAHVTKMEIICIILGIAALVAWQVTREPLSAIIFSMLADFFVTVPTIVKTYRSPETEPALLWILYVFAAVLAIVANGTFTVYNLLFPLYTVLGSLIIALLALRDRIVQRQMPG